MNGVERVKYHTIAALVCLLVLDAGDPLVVGILFASAEKG